MILKQTSNNEYFQFRISTFFQKVKEVIDLSQEKTLGLFLMKLRSDDFSWKKKWKFPPIEKQKRFHINKDEKRRKNSKYNKLVSFCFVHNFYVYLCINICVWRINGLYNNLLKKNMNNNNRNNNKKWILVRRIIILLTIIKKL